MLSDLLWLLILLTFVIPGLKHPYIALCGVIFVDIVKPQTLSYNFLAGKPIALIITLIFFFSVLINIKQLEIPTKKISTILLLSFMGWITYATYQAQFQYIAWIKYDFVIKTLLICVFIPFILNTRIKVETFIAIMMVSIAFFTIIIGLKTLAGGGGYGNSFFISSQKNSGMTESSTMAMVAVLSLPITYYLSHFSLFKERISFLPKSGLFMYFTSITAIIGTFARTGLVGLFVLMSLILKDSGKKFKFLFILTLIIPIGLSFAPQEWLDRMNTIKSADTESSAYGRIVVWKWSFDFIKDNPVHGGGFYAFKNNAGVLSLYSDDPDMRIGRAETGKDFHNMYLSIAGGQGLVGLGLFLLIILTTLRTNKKIIKSTTPNDWEYHFAIMGNRALLVYCACGMFISAGYHPWIYYLLGLSASLHHINYKSLIAKESKIKNIEP